MSSLTVSGNAVYSVVCKMVWIHLDVDATCNATGTTVTIGSLPFTSGTYTDNVNGAAVIENTTDSLLQNVRTEVASAGTNLVLRGTFTSGKDYNITLQMWYHRV